MRVPKNILIVGATSAIAEAAARRWAEEGAQFFLLARNAARLELVAQDLRVRGATVHQARLDLSDIAAQQEAMDMVFSHFSRLDVALIAYGDLPDQTQCEQSVAAMRHAMQTNAISAVAWLTLLANRMQQQKCGVIAVIGSVAGDRGRKSNYVYGSSKALLATFAEGLAGRMRSQGVRVLIIKSGFVDTPMTAKFKKGVLWSTPPAVAKIIHARVAAAHSGAFYAPRFWWLVMWIIKQLPARILNRLNI